MRPMSADRPDITESPGSVDAGHFQLEMDLLVVEHDRGETSCSFAVANLKLGLLDFVDLQVVLRPLVSPPTTGAAQTLGYGDVTLRLKINLFGNGGGAALGVLGWVNVPAPGSLGGGWAGGLALPFGVELPWELELGAMVEVDVFPNERAPGVHPELLGTLALSRSILGPLSMFIEGAVRVSFDLQGAVLATLDGGLLFQVDDDLVFDAGAYVGLTDAAPDAVLFVGVTTRI